MSDLSDKLLGYGNLVWEGGGSYMSVLSVDFVLFYN